MSLFNTAHRNHYFLDVASYLSKVANFAYPRVFVAPIRGNPTGISARSLASKTLLYLRNGARWGHS